jgi:hypothetical protein
VAQSGGVSRTGVSPADLVAHLIEESTPPKPDRAPAGSGGTWLIAPIPPPARGGDAGGRVGGTDQSSEILTTWPPPAHTVHVLT